MSKEEDKLKQPRYDGYTHHEGVSTRMSNSDDTEDVELRKKFSKILGKIQDAPTQQGEQEVYSWEEIFNEIGKLQGQARREGYMEAVEAIPDRYGVHSNNLYDCDLTRLKSRLKTKLNK